MVGQVAPSGGSSFESMGSGGAGTGVVWCGVSSAFEFFLSW